MQAPYYKICTLHTRFCRENSQGDSKKMFGQREQLHARRNCPWTEFLPKIILTMLEFAEVLKVRRKTRWSRKERSFLAISGIPTIMHVQVRGAPDHNSFRCATCESFRAVATCIPTFVACDGSLSWTLKAMICDLGMHAVIGTRVMIVSGLLNSPKTKWSTESCWWLFHVHLCRSLFEDAT